MSFHGRDNPSDLLIWQARLPHALFMTRLKDGETEVEIQKHTQVDTVVILSQ